MKRFLLISAFIACLSCEDRQSQPIKTNSKSTSTTEKRVVKKDTIKEEAIDFPFLTTENAMEFLLKYEKANTENKVRITTKFGDIDILLFDVTKFHRANFIYLTKRDYFDKTQFYRVSKDFVIQAGNTDDPKVKRKRGNIGRYLLPPDTKRGIKHDRGIVSMPSGEIEDAYKLASPFEFFIVQAKNGAYHLDGEYTAFGKVINGMDVVDEIAAQETDDGEWPLRNIYIEKVEIID